MTTSVSREPAEHAHGQRWQWAWLGSAAVGVLLVFGVLWAWGVPLTNDGPAHLFSAFVFNHHDDPRFGFAEHFDLRSPITGNGWRLIAWMEPWVGWQLAYRLWYVVAAELAFLSAWSLWLAYAVARGASQARALPWLALVLSLPLGMQMSLYLGTVAYLLGISFALFGIALLVGAKGWRGFAAIGALWLVSAWFHPVPVALAGVLAGVAVLAGEDRRARLSALALASLPTLLLLAAFLRGGGEPSAPTENRFAPLMDRTVLLLSRLWPSPAPVCGLMVVAAAVGLALALAQGKGAARGLAIGASCLFLGSMLLPEHAFGWQLVAGRLLPLAAPVAFASLAFAPARTHRVLLALGALTAAVSLLDAFDRNRALARSSEEALAGIAEMEPARLRLVEIITRPYGTDAQDLGAVPENMEPMGKLSSAWAVAAGGRPMFTFASRKFAVHPLMLRPSEPHSPFPVHDADKVRDTWPERGDDLRRMASSAAGVGGLFAFGEPEDARVYDEAGFVRVGGRGAVYLGRFEGCGGKVLLTSETERELEVSVGWWPRRIPQLEPSRVIVGPGGAVHDTGMLGCGEVWVAVTPGRCAEGTPSRARFARGQDNVLTCTVVDGP